MPGIADHENAAGTVLAAFLSVPLSSTSTVPHGGPEITVSLQSVCLDVPLLDLLDTVT